MSEIDYVLGTNDDEIERLGLQHRVWRPRMLDAWRRAGITSGQRVIDVGSGPGWASIDLAEIVGAQGSVVAVERSARFVAHLRARATAGGLTQIEIVEADVVGHDFGRDHADGAWVRWLLSFAADPRRVVGAIAAALKPGGVAVFHEYLQYRTWRVLPGHASLDAFAQEVVDGWRASGAEPDVAVHLPQWLGEAGMVIEEARPLIDVVRPSSDVWRWPASFVDVNLDRQIALGRTTPAQAAETRAALAAAEADPNAWMVTPLMLEVIARRPI